MTAVLRHETSSRRPRLRLAPAPSCSPPFDDELGRPLAAGGSERISGGPGPVQGALALAFALPSGVPAVPAPPPRLRVVGRDLARRPAQPTGSAARPDVARWAAMVVQAAVEVVAGDRPLTQLARWTTPEVYEQLQWRRRRPAATSAPGATSAVGAHRAVVASVHVCLPQAEVAEACATVRTGGRATAVAIRLEADRDSWRCTAISIG